MNQKICIVGDRFHEFAELPHVMTFTQFIKQIAQAGSESIQIYVGQGLNFYEHAILNKALSDHNGLTLGTPDPTHCPGALTHKQKIQNILISEPSELSPKTYEAWLTIDDGCADLSDHMTGDHIQGALIAEAARQMVLAVNEKFTTQSPHTAIRFVTHATIMTYHDYIFPVAVRISYQTISLRKGLNGNYRSTARIEFWQNEKCRATCEFQFSVFEADFLQRQERTMAHRAVEEILSPGEQYATAK